MKQSLPLFKKLNKWPHWVRLLLALTLGTFAFLLYANLGRDSLFNWDEGIYAELGRELIQGGPKYALTSSWNGSLWLEKPPGIAWITALSMSFFGVSELGARAFMPLFALLTLIFVFLIGKRLGNWRMGTIAAALLSTYDLFLGRARGVNTDGILLSAIAGTYYAALVGASPIIIALGIFAGVWVKGIAGLLVALIILPLILKRGIWYMLHVTCYTLLFILPWHFYQYFVHGSSFYTPYFLEQVVRRATVPIEFHMESRWFYFNFLYENLHLGALVLLGLGVFIILKNFRRSPAIYLVWWLVLPLAIFTLAKTRLFWYILPTYPAIALITAYLFTRFDKSKLERSMITILIIGLCGQSIMTVARSVELDKKIASPPLDVQMAQTAAKYPSSSLYILVPQNERTAEAILPVDQRISSSFRYGGSPNLVFYSQKQVTYFYDVDKWIAMLHSNPGMTMFAVSDLPRLPAGYVVESINKEYVLATKVQDDNR